MTKRSAVLSLAAVATFATVAYAAVTFDPATGTGFVGKGDVQLAFGWNNATLQQEAGNLAFTYQDEIGYDVACMKVIEQKKQTRVLRKVFQRSQELTSSLTYDARRTNQVNGFNLSGIGSTTVLGEIDCTDPHDPSESGWEIDEEAGGATQIEALNGRLLVSHGGSSAVIWTEAPAAEPVM